MLLHFLQWLAEVMSQAEFYEHKDTGITCFSTPNGKDYLVANLSYWPRLIEANQQTPFPVHIIPILLEDVPLQADTPQPKSRYLLARGRGLTWIEKGEKVGYKDLPHKKGYCKEGCYECLLLVVFEGDYSLPV